MLYVLDENNQPCREENSLKWAQFFEDIEKRKVKSTEVRGVTVSTVFLGIDHNHFGGGAPILFETMVFGHNQDSEEEFYDFQERYCTWDEAVAGHKSVVDNILNGGIGVLQ